MPETNSAPSAQDQQPTTLDEAIDDLLTEVLLDTGQDIYGRREIKVLGTYEPPAPKPRRRFEAALETIHKRGNTLRREIERRDCVDLSVWTSFIDRLGPWVRSVIDYAKAIAYFWPGPRPDWASKEWRRDRDRETELRNEAIWLKPVARLIEKRAAACVERAATDEHDAARDTPGRSGGEAADSVVVEPLTTRQAWELITDKLGRSIAQTVRAAGKWLRERGVRRFDRGGWKSAFGVYPSTCGNARFYNSAQVLRAIAVERDRIEQAEKVFAEREELKRQIRTERRA